MKQFNIHLILLFLLCPLLGSCFKDRDTARLLDNVSSYIQEFPDSALKIINSIDTLDIVTKQTRAKYSLLLSTALDKNYIDTTNINVIMPAVAYYERHGDYDAKMKSLYYLGRIYYNSNALTDAIVSFTKALPFTEKVSDKKYVEMLYTMIALTYDKNYNYEEALSYYKKAYDGIISDPKMESHAINALFRSCLNFNRIFCYT